MRRRVHATIASGRRIQTRAAVRLTIVDDAIPPAPGLSAVYGCRTPGCTDGTCAYCSDLREWGARCVCTDCGAPLELWPHQFIGRPLCGECGGRIQ